MIQQCVKYAKYQADHVGRINTQFRCCIVGAGQSAVNLHGVVEQREIHARFCPFSGRYCKKIIFRSVRTLWDARWIIVT
jgi:hypothetical protein